MGLCIFQTTQNNLHNICKMFQKIPKCDSKNSPRSHSNLHFFLSSLRHPPMCLEPAARSHQDLQHGSSNSSSSPLRGEGIIGGAWGSSEAGTPHGQRGWGSKRPSPAAALHCFCRTRDLHKSKARPLLIACRCAAVRRGTACIAMHAAAAGPRPSELCTFDVRA